ncbi:MAG: patatin-like phospholipase family protein [Deltaproteobacteria bacterium]|nr:patatin-like phospholipase family protein [Deltaproteobacteria bacterium]
MLKVLIITSTGNKYWFEEICGISGNHTETDSFCLKQDGMSLEFRFVFSLEQAVSESIKSFWDCVVIDADPDRGIVEKFLVQITGSNFGYLNVSCSRTLLVFRSTVPDTEEILHLGKKKAGGIYIHKYQNNFLENVLKLARPKNPGKTAVCCAGGGIEGLIYEIGALRCVDESLKGSSLTDFDNFYGISAGAIMASCLANGIPPVELARSFMHDSTVLSSIKPGKLFDPALSELFMALFQSFSSTAFSNESILHKLFRAVPNAFFKGDIIEKVIKSTFNMPGMTNDFKNLKKGLYIGATDQDTYEHVVFGSRGWDDIPISRAIHASMSLIPFYTPQYINGRWFIDGSYTRTSEIEVAIEDGATLIIIVDPLVPIRSGQSGFVKSKGGVFASIQGLKALINTRFMGMLPHLAESHPEVDIIIFVPKEDDMRIMSGSPLKLNFQVEIERISYEETKRRMVEQYHFVKTAFERHGLEIDIDSSEL